MSPSERALAIARSLGLPAGRATPLPGGNQNHVVRVRGDGSDVVVRFAKSDDRMPDPFDAEAWCLEAAELAGIRTSPLIARGQQGDVSYLVTGFVPGEPASPDDLGAWREVGGFAAALARIDLTTAPAGLFSRFGRDLDTAWRDHLAYNRAALAATDDPLPALGVYGADDRPRLERLLASLEARALPQGLVHGDLSTRNVVSDGGRHTVIDWGSARTGPSPWSDLEQLHRWIVLEDPESPVSPAAWAAVLDGAGLTAAQSAPVLDELTALNALDVVRWAIDRRPDRVAALAAQSSRLLRWRR